MRTTTVSTAHPYYTNQSVVKAVAILRSFNKSIPKQTVKEISERLGLTRSVVQKLVMTLLDLGLLVQEDATRRYSISPRIMEIASPFLNTSPLIANGRAHVQEIVEQTDMTGALGIREGLETLYLISLEPDASVKANSMAGERTPLHCTATGKCLLAFANDEERASLLPRLPLERFTEYTISDLNGLEQDLEDITKRGYATNLEERVIGLCGIAVPVHTESEGLVAALSVGIPKASVSQEQYPEFARLASAVARDLGQAIESYNTPCYQQS